jgi:hypothetical protein
MSNRNDDVGRLWELVRAEYDRVARESNGSFHFHRGPEYACRMLRYELEVSKEPLVQGVNFLGEKYFLAGDQRLSK